MDHIDILALARRIQGISSYHETGWEDLDKAATLIRQQHARIQQLENTVHNIESGLLYLNSLFGKVH